jgi:hypothetical protein
MPKLISIGLLSGLFFSSTFILNRLMSMEGGHWVWSGSLRYAYMILMLARLDAGVPGHRCAGRCADRALVQALVVLDHWPGASGSAGFTR